MTDDITSILLLHSHADTCRYIERAIARCGSGIKIDCPDQVTEVDVTQCRQQLIVGWDQFKVADDTTLLHLFRTQSVPVPVIFISSDGNSKNAVEAIRAGASDFLVQDSDEDLIIEAVRHALNQHSPATQPVDTFDEAGAERKMVSCCSEMQQVIQLADRVAPSDATILIRGESGTGKELLSRYIHEHSGRTKGRLVAMNCAALPEQLVESELFGYEKGAFTGAAGKRQGRFEQAHQGTLMLDEISSSVPAPATVSATVIV